MSLLQHWFDGGVPLLIADRHELSCKGLHVTASAAGASDKNTATATTTAQSGRKDNFFISNILQNKRAESERERIYGGAMLNLVHLGRVVACIYRSDCPGGWWLSLSNESKVSQRVLFISFFLFHSAEAKLKSS